MLSRLQPRYAEQPVRFLVFPSNTFDQEPGSNKDIKSFAEQYVTLGSGSNVVMFAKSNVNNVTCTAKGDNVCTAASTKCCPANDPIYDYLLAVTTPGNVDWNFGKIVVDGAGHPFAGEYIMDGSDLDASIATAIVKCETKRVNPLETVEMTSWRSPASAFEVTF